MSGAAPVELYVYYRVALAHGTDEATRGHAIEEIRAAQATLCAALPGLSARLLRRAGEVPAAAAAADGTRVQTVQTWMEVYRSASGPDSGLDAAAINRIESVMAALPSARQGPRISERFEPLPQRP